MSAFQTLNNINRQQQQQQGAVARRGPMDFPALLEMNKNEIARALPKHLNPDRIARIALTSFRKTPALGKCDPMSVLAAVVQASQLGLEIGMNGEAHLVPFQAECQLIPGYLGLMKLARQSGLVSDIYAHEVRAGDRFKLKLGTDRLLEHDLMTLPCGFPVAEDVRGQVVGFYAVAVLNDGSRAFEVITLQEVERIRNNSSGYKFAKAYGRSSPWDTDFVPMGLKTIIRRLCKYLPKSAELSMALALDAVAEAGQSQKIDLQQAADGSYVPTIHEDGEGSSDTSNAAPAAPPVSTPKSNPASAPQRTQARSPAQAQPQAQPQAPRQAPQRAAAAQPAAVMPATDAKAKEENNQQHTQQVSRVDGYMARMRQTPTIDDLNEVYIRAEGELEGADLEAIAREYNVQKARIDGNGTKAPNRSNGLLFNQ